MNRTQKAALAPQRRCLVSRNVLPCSRMVRFVVSPEGTVVADLKGTLPGRGVWITSRKPLVECAVKDKLFTKGFKAHVLVEPDFADKLEQQLEQSALSFLSIARKAGAVILGSAKLESAIRKRELAALLHAVDASENGIKKLNAEIRKAHKKDEKDVLIFRQLTVEKLSIAFNSLNVVHIGLRRGHVSRIFIEHLLRMNHYGNTKA